MKGKKINLFTALLLSTLVLSACNNNPTDGGDKKPDTPVVPVVPDEPDVPEEPVIPEEPEPETPDFSKVVFENATVTYDGKPHSLVATNIPTGYTVTYSPESGTNAGNYTINAYIVDSQNQIVSLKTARLTINKAPSVLSAASEQVGYSLSGGLTPKYTLNNTEQVVDVKSFGMPGEYTTELYAPATVNYLESNHVNVKVIIKPGVESGTVFASKQFVYDGTPKTIEVSNLPTGYSVEYEGNTATNYGSHYAKAIVKKPDNSVECELHAILDIDYPNYADFDQYCKEFFLDYLEDDFSAWNVFAKDPTNFGYFRDLSTSAEYYMYDKEEYVDDYANYSYTENTKYHAMLEEFKDKPLSNKQRAAYRAIDSLFYQILDICKPGSEYNPYMEMGYIDQFGGYVANFNSTMEGYTIRNEQDIKDIISYINSMPECLSSYVEYGKDKANAGYAYSDYTLDKQITFVNDLIPSEGEDIYFVGILADKINAIDLSSSLKSSYISQIKNACKDTLIPAYANFAKEVATLKGKLPADKEGYYSIYSNGSEYYLNALKDRIGVKDVTLESFKTEVEEALKSWISIYMKVNPDSLKNRKDKQKYELCESGALIFDNLLDSKNPENVPYNMLEFLKEFSKTIVPVLNSEPDIKVKYMSAAEEKTTNAVAYYRKSTIDSDATEYITLNNYAISHIDEKTGKVVTDYNSLLETMAHEGYPGHLYEYVNSKELGLNNIAVLLSSTAHGEGWATYVSYKLWDYIIDTYDGDGALGVETYCKSMQSWNVVAYLLYTYVDLLVNGFQLKGDELLKTCQKAGPFNWDAVLYGSEDDPEDDGLIKLLTEIPGEYASYGYGQYKFIQLHQIAQEKLGSYYDEVAFNEYILSEGWCAVERVIELANEFVDRQCFIYNIQND